MISLFKINRSAALCLAFIPVFFCLDISAAFAADEDEESRRRQQHFIHFRYGPEVAYTSSPSGGTYTAHAAPHAPTEVQIHTGQANIKQTLKNMGNTLSVGDTLKVYASAGEAGFHAVHGSIGAGDINSDVSRQLGQNRQKFHQEVLFELAKSIQSQTYGLGINDFGSGADPSKINAKGDIDFTLYAKNLGVDAQWLVDQYNQTFKKLAKSRYGIDLTPGQMDIVAHRYDATIPDHRVRQSLADFELKLKTGTRLLRANPEAYFLEGSYLQQIMGRSVAPDKKTFTWYSPDKTADNGVKVIRVNAAAVPEFFYKPNFRKALGFGGAVGNYHFHHAHSDSFIAKTKYVLRSLDNGPGLLVSGKRGDYTDIGSKEDVASGLEDPVGRAERRKIIDDIYNSPQLKYSEALRQEIFETYEVCRKARIAKDLRKTISDKDLYGALAEHHKKISQVRLDDGRTVQFEIDDVTAMKLAKQTFKSTSELILTTNVVRTAGSRAREWLRPNTLKNRVSYVDENGNMVSVKADKTDLKRLQFAAFQEIQDAIQILQQDKKNHVVELLKKRNPAMKQDIELIEGIIRKKREMMIAPENKNSKDAYTYRQKAAQGVIEAFDQLGRHKEAAPMWSKVFKSANDVWAAGQALESYVYSNLTQAVIYSGGRNYGPALERLRQSTENVNKQIMNPVWMTRISRANSVVHVLTLYAEEGAFNEKVLKQAIIEGLSHFPLIGMPIDIYRGTVSGLLNHKGGLDGLARAALGSGAGQIVLSQFIPGYGPVILVVNTAKGVVNLGGTVLFAPLKDQRIKLAYQGYLDPADFSGSNRYTKWLIEKTNTQDVNNSISWWFSSTGRKDRIYSPRPSVLHPIDPEMKMSLQERRTAVLRHFQPKFVSLFKEKWGGAATVSEHPALYSEIENEFLPKVMYKHVHDWWEGQGVFSEYDSLAVKRMMDEYYDKEMKQKIVSLLISDYIAGKGELIKQENEWYKSLNNMYAFLAGIVRDYTKWYVESFPLISESHKKAANIFLGLEQEEAEHIEPKIELVSSPKVIMGEDSEGNSIPIIERINIRTKVLVSETMDRPGPYEIRYKIKSAGSEKQIKEKEKAEFEFKSGQVPENITLTALLLDGNNQVFHEQDIVVPIMEKEVTADYEGGQDLKDVFYRLEEMLKKAREEASKAQSSIRNALQELAKAKQESAGLKQRIEKIKTSQKDIEKLLAQISVPEQRIQNKLDFLRDKMQEIEKIEIKAENLAQEICNRINEIQSNPGNRSSIQNDAASKKKQLSAVIADAPQIQQRYLSSLKEIESDISKISTYNSEITRMLGELSDDLDDSLVLDHILKTDDQIVEAAEHVNTIKDILVDARKEHEKGIQYIKELEISSEDRKKKQQKLDELMDQLKEVESETDKTVKYAVNELDKFHEKVKNQSLAIDHVSEKNLNLVEQQKREIKNLEELSKEYQLFKQKSQDIGQSIENLNNAKLDADVCSESIQHTAHGLQTMDDCNRITQALKNAYLDSDADAYNRLLQQYENCPEFSQAQTVLQNIIQQNQRCNALAQQLNTARKNGDSVTYGQLLNQFKDCKFYPQAQAEYNTMLQTDRRCNEIAGQLNSAQQRGDIRTYQTLLNQFRDCNHYNTAVTAYNNMVQNANYQRCQSLLNQLNQAQQRGDVRTYGSLLNQAGDCPFYSQAGNVYNGMKNQQTMQAVNTFLGGMMQIINQQNQGNDGPSRPPLAPNPPGNSYNRPPQTTTRPPSTGTNQAGGLSQAECEKKFCPVCATGGSIDLIGVSVNQQCNDCRSRFKKKIEDCMRGGVSANRQGASMSQFRNYQVIECRKPVMDYAGRITGYNRFYEFSGPGRRRPNGSDCSVVPNGNGTWEECIDRAQKYNQQAGNGYQVLP